LWVELCGAAEITRSFVMIEPIQQPNAVVEVDLRVGIRRRDRKVVVAQPRVKLRGRGRQGLVRVLLCCGSRRNA
jgi:hypothetical protein